MTTKAELLRTISLAGFPANECFAGDLDGDGRMELLFLQSPGIYQSAVFDGTRWAVPHWNREIFCLTAVDAAGKVMWQFGKPYLGPQPYAYHVADQMVWCEDLDGDGRVEVICIRGDELIVLAGATGKVLRSARLPADNFGIVRGFQARDGRRLLVKNTEAAYPPHCYGDPALILDSSLAMAATLPRTIGSGHSPRAFDLDQDGVDELLIGYAAYAADGRPLWRLEGIDQHTYDPIEDHVDQLLVHRGRETGEIRIAYAGSSQTYVAAADGRLLWRRPLGHAQHVLAGDFRDGPRRASLVFLNLIGPAHLVWMDDRGNTVNVTEPRPNWPGQPGCDFRCHSGEGILLYPQGCPDGGDAVILRDFGWPTAVNLAGEVVFEFPFLRRPASACGFEVGNEGYGLRIFDFDGDGRAEVLIHDFDAAWVFKPPFPPVGRPCDHARLAPVTGQRLR